MPQVVHLNTKIPQMMAGQRLDQALATLFPDYSRARLQQWIREGLVSVNERSCKPKDKVQGDEQVVIQAVLETEVSWLAQALPLEILYEDADLLVINKPAGLVVHPGAGNPDATLVNALLHHAPELAELPRAGIIHRLDKDTSGVLVIARRLESHSRLVAQLQARAFEREYCALVNGVVSSGGRIDLPIGRHPTQRTRMAVVNTGKPAVSHYRVLARYQVHSLVQVKLETGRTHQIRVHMAHLKHPVLGDPVYGGRLRLPPGADAPVIQALQQFRRQALHAARLGLTHPRSGQFMAWESPLPADMQHLRDLLQADAAGVAG